MTHTEQLDILYKLKKVEKSNNTALLNTINQVIKKYIKINLQYHLLVTFQLVNQHLSTCY